MQTQQRLRRGFCLLEMLCFSVASGLVAGDNLQLPTGRRAGSPSLKQTARAALPLRYLSEPSRNEGSALAPISESALLSPGTYLCRPEACKEPETGAHLDMFSAPGTAFPAEVTASVPPRQARRGKRLDMRSKDLQGVCSTTRTYSAHCKRPGKASAPTRSAASKLSKLDVNGTGPDSYGWASPYSRGALRSSTHALKFHSPRHFPVPTWLLQDFCCGPP